VRRPLLAPSALRALRLLGARLSRLGAWLLPRARLAIRLLARLRLLTLTGLLPLRPGLLPGLPARLGLLTGRRLLIGLGLLTLRLLARLLPRFAALGLGVRRLLRLLALLAGLPAQILRGIPRGIPQLAQILSRRLALGALLTRLRLALLA